MSVGIIKEGQYNKVADKGKCLRLFPSAPLSGDLVDAAWRQCTWATNQNFDLEIKEDGIYSVRIGGNWSWDDHEQHDSGIYLSVVTGNKAVTLVQMNIYTFHDIQIYSAVLKLKAGQKLRFTSRASQVACPFWVYYNAWKWTNNFKEVTA